MKSFLIVILFICNVNATIENLLPNAKLVYTLDSYTTYEIIIGVQGYDLVNVVIFDGNETIVDNNYNEFERFVNIQNNTGSLIITNSYLTTDVDVNITVEIVTSNVSFIFLLISVIMLLGCSFFCCSGIYIYLRRQGIISNNIHDNPNVEFL